MEKNRGKILWIDDEIDHLRPHILFLEEKGFNVTPLTNGRDGIELVKQESFNLVLIDQYMPGLNGVETIRRLRRELVNIPIILITKGEDEALIEEAISEKVIQYLVKPIKPSQIFIACKQVLEEQKILTEKTTSRYLKEFQQIEHLLESASTIEHWWDIYNQLVNWQINFDEQQYIGLESILAEQIQTCNREFFHFISNNYSDWLTQEKRPVCSPEVIETFVVPHLQNQQNVVFILIDGLRLDQMRMMLPMLSKTFKYSIDFHLSILPTATAFSRNSIFSGLFPDDLNQQYPNQKKVLSEQSSNLNQFEKQFLMDQLKRLNLSNTTYMYEKIWKAEDGIKLSHRILDLLDINLITLVINFVDMLAHKRSESELLKEMVPDEAGYRNAVRSWFRHSWLLQLLQELNEKDVKVVITSDHGSIRVHQGVVVGGDRSTSTGIRYKYGRNLNCDSKHALIINNPKDYKLPEFGPQTTYLIAKDDVYFLYPTQYHKYKSMLEGSFQHGGISMEEILVPVLTLESKQ